MTVAQCSDISPLLGGFEDGELEAHEMHEVARHLAQCKACEAELAENAAVGRYLRAAAVEPALDGFAEAVQARLATLTPPIHVRLGRYLQAAGEQFGAAFAWGAAALATAALTAVILTPHLSRIVSSHQKEPVQSASASPTRVPGSGEFAQATVDSHTVISGLESHVSSVAVWNEPETQTTVIWVPDQR
jgi:putative zinc finger protein